MYFAALTDGLAEIPDPGPAARAEARRLLRTGTRRPARPPGTRRIPPPLSSFQPDDSHASPEPGKYGEAPVKGLVAWQT